MDARQSLRERLGDHALVAGVRVGVQQYDGHGLGLECRDGLGEGGGVLERAQDAVRTGALRGRDAQGRWHERGRSGRAQAVEVRAGLAPELDDVGEALGRDEHRARAAALEQRVRRHGHAVGEDLDVAGGGAGAREHGPDRRHHALGLVGGSGRRLRRQQPPAGDEHRIGEGPADVDAEQHVRTDEWLMDVRATIAETTRSSV